jgi:opioid growth factor receptor-like protein
VTESQRLVAFYERTGTDGRGRSLEDILRFDDEQLEAVHDFIQWLFPLPERSGANASAPVLDDWAITQFRARSELRLALRRSLDRMLTFYGFQWSGDRITESASFGARSSNWLHAGNHNHLRLTRMLRSLSILGERQAARALFDALERIYADERRPGRCAISPRSFEFWKNAIEA